MTSNDNFARIEKIAMALPEAERVDIEAWGGEPSFRVREKNFVFSPLDGAGMTVKLGKEEALSVVGSNPDAEPTGYGLGRHGWVSVTFARPLEMGDWEEITEWIHTSYTNVAPRKLAQLVFPDAD